MAGYKGHIMFGILIVALLIYLLYNYNLFKLDLLNFIFLLFIVLIYSILPDIDISSSKISKIIRTVGLLAIIILIFFNKNIIAIVCGCVLLILQFIKHRKFIHTISAGLLFSLPLIYFNYILALFAFIAYLSHLLLDGKVKFL